MDAFFASVEERDKPYLSGMPVIIGADPEGGNGRGVVSTANYQARKLGIGSALPIQKAWRLCEESHKQGGTQCVFILPSMNHYSTASKEVFDIVRTYVKRISKMSVDEASLDLSFCDTYTDAEKLAYKIKREIKNKTKLTCSIGIGENRMIAKIASDYEKPNGLTIILPNNSECFLNSLPIRSIPGVGKVSQQKLLQMGVKTVADVQKYSWEELQDKFGKHGFALWEKVHGIDERKVENERPKNKSIGKHYTFDKDTHDIKQVSLVIKEQIKTIIKQVNKQGFKNFRTVVLTVRFDDFITRTRSLTLDSPISTERDLGLKATKLLLPFFESKENPKNKAIRLIGVRVEKLG